MQRSERQWAQYERSAIHEYDILQERYDEEVEARQRDRQRLRRVLGMGKQERFWHKAWRAAAEYLFGLLNAGYEREDKLEAETEEISAESIKFALLAGDRWYWSAAWKAKCKDMRLGREAAILRMDNLEHDYGSMKAERDGLQQQLDAIWDDPVSVCEKCDEAQQIVPLQRQCDELRRRLEEAQQHGAEMAVELLNIGLRLDEARTMLRKHEWCYLGSCPECGEDHSSGHLDELTLLDRGPCKLAAALREGE